VVGAAGKTFLVRGYCHNLFTDFDEIYDDTRRAKKTRADGYNFVDAWKPELGSIERD